MLVRNWPLSLGEARGEPREREGGTLSISGARWAVACRVRCRAFVSTTRPSLLGPHRSTPEVGSGGKGVGGCSQSKQARGDGWAG